MRIRHFPTAWLPLALLLLAWATWSPALKNGFLAGDPPGSGASGPLVGATYRLDAWLHGSEPRGFHATNVSLHALAAVALFLLLRRLRVPWLAGGISAGLFAIHPALAEPVAHLTGRPEILCGLFLLLTLWADLGRQNLGYRLLAPLCLAAALLSRESAVVAPFMAALLAGVNEPHRGEAPARGWELLRILARRTGARWEMFVVIGLYAAARALHVLTPLASHEAGRGLGGISRVAVIPHIQALLAAPWLGRIEYGPSLRLWVLLPGFVLGTALLGLLWLLSRSHVRSRRWERVPSVRRALLVAAILAYLPSIVAIARGGVAADRLVYLPAAFAIPAAALSVARHMRRRAFLFIGAALLVVCIPAAATRASWWRSDSALLERAARAPYPSPELLVRLGTLQHDAGDLREALRSLQKAQRARRTAPGHAMLGRLYAEVGWDHAAMKEFRGAVAIDPSDAESAARLVALRAAAARGETSGDDGTHPQALSDAATLNARAEVLLAAGDLDGAWVLLLAVERLAPGLLTAEPGPARAVLEEVVKADPRNLDARRILARIERADRAER